MRRFSILTAALFGILLLSAGIISAGPQNLVAQLSGGADNLEASENRNFRTHLTGGQEVPPNDTRAQGQAIFQLSKDGSELSYKLIVANIENVTQAHIHCGPQGDNGPVVAFLYPDAPPPVLIPGRSDGVLAQGTLNNDSVIPRPDSEVCPGGVANFDEVLAQIRNGNAYVNVHTSQFPPGEIRGQIR